MENVTAATAEVAATAAADSGRHGPAFLVALLFMITAATVANLIAGSRVKKAKLDNLRFVTFPVSTEFVGMGEALRFPLTGSCVLFGLYMAYRYLPKEIINAILSAYLCLIGSGAVTIAVKPVLGANVIIGSIAIAVGAGYYWSKHWILNNILAFSLCVAGTESIPIKSFQASAALLIALFFYDIFWVFGTDVMVTVAKNVDGPIKLLFPQDIFGDHTKKSLLGLGDIVVPGFFLMQMVRFSLIQSKGKSMKYFNVCMVAYVAALINAMFIMVYFDAAQPVLLYIVPWLLLTALGTAAATGQFKQLWDFDDEAHEKALLEEARAKFPERVAEAEKEAADRNNMSVVASIVDALLSVFGLDADSKKEAAAKKNKAAAKKKSA